MKNYYALVASMPDLSPDDAKLALTISDFKEDYWPGLAAEDKHLVSLFFLQYDHRNLLGLLSGDASLAFDERGMYAQERLAEAIEQVKTGEELGRELPGYFYTFISAYPEIKETGEVLPEDALTTAYYEYAKASKNRFVSDWFTFNLHVNNILTALTARKYGFSAAPYLVGNDEVSEALASSGARDFGLSTEIDYMDELMRIAEWTDPVEKERKLDLLKWNWLEEHTFFHYFSVERLFAFLLKLDIVERWTKIDKEKGGKVFRSLIEQLKNEVEIPQEFKK